MGIAIGNKIELVRLDQVIRNEQNKKVYVSKIYDILDQDKLQIAMPIFEGRIVPLDLSVIRHAFIQSVACCNAMYR